MLTTTTKLIWSKTQRAVQGDARSPTANFVCKNVLLFLFSVHFKCIYLFKVVNDGWLTGLINGNSHLLCMCYFSMHILYFKIFYVQIASLQNKKSDYKSHECRISSGWAGMEWSVWVGVGVEWVQRIDALSSLPLFSNQLLHIVREESNCNVNTFECKTLIFWETENVGLKNEQQKMGNLSKNISFHNIFASLYLN